MSTTLKATAIPNSKTLLPQNIKPEYSSQISKY